MSTKRKLTYSQNHDEDSKDVPETLALFENEGKASKGSTQSLDKRKSEILRIKGLERQAESLKDKLNKLRVELDNKKNEYQICKGSVQELKRSREILADEIKDNEEALKLNVNALEIKKRKLESFVKNESIKYDNSIKEYKKLKKEAESATEELSQEHSKIKNNIVNSSKELEKLSDHINASELRLNKKLKNLEDVKLEFEDFKQRQYKAVVEFEEVQARRIEVEKDVICLESYKEELSKLREIEQDKVNDEISANRDRIEFDRQSSFQQLENSLKDREDQWNQSFKARKSSQLRELNCQVKNIESEILDKKRDLDTIKLEALEEARKEADKIKAEANEIYRNSFNERQKLLDEASKIKIDIENRAIDRIEKVNNNIEQVRRAALDKEHNAEIYYQKKSKEGEKLVNSAQRKASKILHNAQAKKKDIINKAEQEKELLKVELDKQEVKWQEEIDFRKEAFKNYLDKRKHANNRSFEQLIKHQKARFEKDRALNDERYEKQKRKELKKVVSLRDRIIDQARNLIIQEKNQFKSLKKKELELLYHKKKELTISIESLQGRYEKDLSKFKKQQEKEQEDLKKKSAEKLNALRVELEKKIEKQVQKEKNDFEKLKKVRSENAKMGIYKFLSQNYSEFIESLPEEEVLNIHKNVEEIISNTFSGKKTDILDSVGLDADASSKKNIKSVAIKYGLGLVLPGLIIILFFTNMFNVRSNSIGLFNKLIEDQKERSLNAENKMVEQKQEVRVFNPEKTSSYKNTYTKNVLYTSEFFTKYETESFQNDWLLEAHSFITNDLELEEELAIDFVSSEGALIKELGEMSSAIDARFSKTSIKKMQTRENEVLGQLKERFRDPENWKAFEAFKTNFFNERF